MNCPRFIQLSTLTTFPATLLNRDDSGLAKRMPFGPCARTRVSSQCLKRHWRMADDAHALNTITEGLDRSVRSRRTFVDMIEEPLIRDGCNEEAVRKASATVQTLLYADKSKGSDSAKVARGKDPAAKKEEKKGRSEIVVLGRPEIAFLTEKIRELASDTPPKMDDWWKKEQDSFTALKYGAGIDAAMFGRFISGEISARVSAAVHVAHAFTVHAAASETDYFTAVDDLQELGSGHINAAELTSGIFYSYVVIDVPQLVSNLTRVEAKNWLAADRGTAAAVVQNFVHLVCTVSPGAKLGATAPYAYAWLALAEVGAQQPRSLADAFLQPVPNCDNMRAASAERLAKFVQDYDAMYGQGPDRYLACLPSLVEADFGATRYALPELAAELARRVREGC